MRAEAGSASLFGVPLYRDPAGAVRAGVAHVPDRHHGDVGTLGVGENLFLETLRDNRIQRLGFLRFAALQALAKNAIASFDIRCPGPDAPIKLLSGGNIQKVILARGLGRVKLVIACQPTRGLDVGAAADVHRRLLEARARGLPSC